MAEISSDLHVGDIGAIIEMTVTESGVAVDISSGTTLELKFLSPSGTQSTKTATLSTDGSDGKMRYVTESAFLDAAGLWETMGYLVLASWTGHTSKSQFYVNPVLF